MNKTIKGVVSLSVAVLVIAVMVIALVWQRGREYSGEEVDEPASPVIRVVENDENDITRVTFTDAYGTAVMLPFTDEFDRIQWDLEGTDYILDIAQTRNKVRAMFSLFASQTIYEDVAEVYGLNLADFGLDPPDLTVTAYRDDGTTMSIYLGMPTGDFRDYFLMVEGSPALYLTATLNAERLHLGLEGLIDANLPEWDTDTMTYLLVAQRDREIIEIEAQEAEGFEGMMFLMMQQPFSGREVFNSSFDHHIMERFSGFRLGDLVNLHPMDLSPYGLDNPSMEFIYRAHRGEAHLLFGDFIFREIDGDEVTFIYVKFADRPHVFEALFEPISAIFDMNVVRFIERFVALVNILDVERMEVATPTGNFDISINHAEEEDSNDIAPIINGRPVDDSDFRVVYRLAIGMGINAEVEPFMPSGSPLFTISYFMHDDTEEEDIVLRLFEHDANFLAVSVNGEEIWYVTDRRSFDRFMDYLNDLIAGS